jgi:hypothetical protein
MKTSRAGRVTTALASLCIAGLAGAGAATAASQTVAWGTTSSAPAGTLGELFGVAAASATDVLAVGGYNPGQPPTAVLTKPYAEHWNGSAWSATTVPLGPVYPSGEQAAQLNGVTEVAAADGWAVGTVSDPSSFASRTLAYHWDGVAWTRTPTPDPAGSALSNQLNAVAARSASSVWAVGSAGDYPARSLVLHWNGSAWRQVSVPDIGSLDAVSLAPGQVWIAGGDGVEQFNGSAWTKLPVAPGVSVITGLAHDTDGLWAVGYTDYGCGEGGTCTASYAALWNGTTWTVVPAGGGTGLSGVVVAGSKVLATGATQVVSLTLTGASAQVTPALGSAQLTAIAADPLGNPWAVGWRTTDAQGTTKPTIINAPGIGQGGITVTTGAAEATVTWVGPVNGAGSTDQGGRFAVGGLPVGSYTVTASLPGCQPGTATVQVVAGYATAVNAPVSCPP